MKKQSYRINRYASRACNKSVLFHANGSFLKTTENTFLSQHPISWRNPTNQRYYIAYLHRDLLGDWVITQQWGGIASRRGRIVNQFCETTDKALTIFHRIHKIRTQHGYQLQSSYFTCF